MRTHSALTLKIPYSKLNNRQRENYNFQKLSGLMADFGFVTIRLSDDWNGADFLAQHIDGRTVLRIQLKGRLAIADKYLRKDTWLAFPVKGNWYVCPHDGLFRHLMKSKNIRNTMAYRRGGAWSFATPPRDVAEFLVPYELK